MKNSRKRPVRHKNTSSQKKKILPVQGKRRSAKNYATQKEVPSAPASAILKGIVRQSGADFTFTPIQKELQAARFIILNPSKDLRAGNIARVQVGKRKTSGPAPVKVLEVLSPNLQGLESKLVAEAFEIPSDFPPEVMAAAKALPNGLTKEEIAEREDLRPLPLVTIDGADAKDFDDAVWAEETDDGFHLIVAIADVAHYVAEGSVLDKEALERGNSTYFPDMVIPMLPEEISNNLCSLRPHEDRPTLVCHMWINQQGKLVKHKFTRGVIHSAARLTYTQAQAALNGDVDETASPVLESTLKPLFKAYQALIKARVARGALDLDLPESHLITNDKGDILAIEPRERMDTHKLIEEMMILANVAAATALQTKGAPALYRIHDAPTAEKIENLNTIFTSHNISNKLSKTPQPLHIQRIINSLKDHASAPVLMQSVLQSQQRATYDPQNIGHFGLALQRYAHFTSPIRRYSDLIVHRSLIKCLNLPGKGAMKLEPKKLADIAEHINKTERRSQQAEWDVRDKMTARFYHDFIGKEFTATVISVLNFGAFLQIEGGAGEGLLPFRLMQNDHYVFDEKKQQLFGKKTKQTIKVGSELVVTLAESNTFSGKLTFALKKIKEKACVAGVG